MGCMVSQRDDLEGFAFNPVLLDQGCFVLFGRNGGEEENPFPLQASITVVQSTLAGQNDSPVF